MDRTPRWAAALAIARAGVEATTLTEEITSGILFADLYVCTTNKSTGDYMVEGWKSLWH